MYRRCLTQPARTRLDSLHLEFAHSPASGRRLAQPRHLNTEPWTASRRPLHSQEAEDGQRSSRPASHRRRLARFVLLPLRKVKCTRRRSAGAGCLSSTKPCSAELPSGWCSAMSKINSFDVNAQNRPIETAGTSPVITGSGRRKQEKSSAWSRDLPKAMSVCASSRSAPRAGTRTNLPKGVPHDPSRGPQPPSSP